MISYTWLEEAAQRIAPFINHTPLSYDPHLNLYLKWENRQVTGSFKIRGVLNKVLTLSKSEHQRGLVAASAGNHGKGLAWAGKLFNLPVTVFCSEQAMPAKVKAMEALDAQVKIISGGYGEAEKRAIEYARDNNLTWVSPYNDPHVIAGQGTLALEACWDLPHDLQPTWLVPTGGAGLLAGIGLTLERNMPQAKLFAVQPEASPFMHAIFKCGNQTGIIDLPTLADGLAGPVDEQSITIPLLSRFASDCILVSEAEITKAIAYAWHQYGEIIEGSAATALTAILTNKITDLPAVVVISGGNIDSQLHAEIVRSKLEV